MKALLVDDHGLFRHGMELLLTSRLDFSVIYHADNGEQAMQQLSENPDIDIVFLDYNLGTDLGIDVLLRMKARDPSLPISIVSGRDDPEIVMSALGNGASGFIFKHMEPDGLVEAISLILEGGMFVPESMVKKPASQNDSVNLDIYSHQVQHIAEVARKIISEKDLSLRAQEDVECEMTSALNNLLQELQDERARLEDMAFNDELTGIANRRLFFERLDQALKGARRNHVKAALIYVDLDHFKEINDTLGHPIGDEVLLEVSQRLTSILRETDTVARIGGDEFTIILPEVPSDDGIEIFMRRLYDVLRKELTLSSGQILQPTASIGVALSDGTDSVDEIIEKADQTLYKVKQAGRDNFAILEDAPSQNTPKSS